jgi:hypothetical protein
MDTTLLGILVYVSCVALLMLAGAMHVKIYHRQLCEELTGGSAIAYQILVLAKKRNITNEQAETMLVLSHAQRWVAPYFGAILLWTAWAASVVTNVDVSFQTLALILSVLAFGACLVLVVRTAVIARSMANAHIGPRRRPPARAPHGWSA